jgi:predicted O-methyltransferase YrrM
MAETPRAPDEVPAVTQLPPDLQSVIDEAWRLVDPTPGHLTEREARFLVLVAACAPARGTVVEIGSYKGRSTVGLAFVTKHYGLDRVVTTDPHTSPSITDPDEPGESSYEAFRSSLAAAGVAGDVEAHRAYSRDLARGWTRPIRLLWIDGDHTYAGVKEDLDLLRPYLVRGGVVALHDVLGNFEGPIRVFVNDVLGSDDFGPAGLCGSIGWAQYRPGEGASRRFRRSRRRLARRVAMLIPLLRPGKQQVGLVRIRYNVWRALVPHHAVPPEEWAAAVALEPDA